MAIRRTVLLVLVVGCGLVAGGCGKKGLQVEYVEGIVLLDGEPVGDAAVGLSPVDGAGLPATGRTRKDGIFHVTATRGGRADAGVPAGEYVMTVTKAEYDLQGKSPPAEGDYSNIPVRHVVPVAYGFIDTSGIRMTVPPGGGRADKFRFELRSDFKGTSTGNETVK